MKDAHKVGNALYKGLRGMYSKNKQLNFVVFSKIETSRSKVQCLNKYIKTKKF